MPTVSVGRDALYAELGMTFTQEEFEDVCFEFGVELDEVVEEEKMTSKTRGTSGEEVETETVFKIDVSANRYDLLCLEGMSLALGVFLGKRENPNFRKVAPVGPPITMTVSPETAQIRPYVVCAVLRNTKFNAAAYDSFLDLQDKLHTNICRRRTLVAIGTHNLDTLEPPFTYKALAPKDIKFAPLAKDREFQADELMDFYEKNDLKLKKFLPIIRDSPVYPVLYDAQDRVLSLPPIINGNHSRISADTKNVFIECTATDITKANIVLNTIIAMFSGYCEEPFTVEPVQVIYPEGPSHPKFAGQTVEYPDLSERECEADIDYIRKSVGLTTEELPTDKIVGLLDKMMVKSTIDEKRNCVIAKVPITRSDIMQACDVMEDVAVAYSFNKIPRVVPFVACNAGQQPLNKLQDLLRNELAQAGYTEVLTLALTSTADNFEHMRQPDDGTAVTIANPKTLEFQVVRTCLLPGLFKTLYHNKEMGLPWKVFEVSDVCFKDPSTDTGARNQRRVAFVYASSSGSGFEVIQGMLERIMMLLPVADSDWKIEPTKNPTYFDGRAANIVYKGAVVGSLGTVHPEVLGHFQLNYPASALEMQLEPFL